VRVRNTGTVQLARAGTMNSRFPECGWPSLGTLDPGEEVDYTCAGTAALDDTPTAIVASGDALGQPPARAVSGFATVDVVHPALAVTSEPAGGQTDITVANIGDVEVTGLTTTTPGCGRRDLGTLLAGSRAVFRCPAGSGVLAAAATGAGRPVTAAATLRASRADVVISQRVSAPIVRPGSPVTLTVTVRNTGSSVLARISLRDAVFPVCDGLRSGRLAPGQRARLTCTIAAPSADVNRLPVVVAEPESGPPLAAVGDPVLVDVVSPVLAVTLAADPSAPFPGDPVRWRLTVANAGDVTIRGVAARSSLGPCGIRPGTLRPGAAPGAYECTVPMGASTVSDAVTVTGRLSTGERITEVVTARATVRSASGLGGLGGPVPRRARSRDTAEIPGGPGFPATPGEVR
jgi:hypothetical protein